LETNIAKISDIEAARTGSTEPLAGEVIFKPKPKTLKHFHDSFFTKDDQRKKDKKKGGKKENKEDKANFALTSRAGLHHDFYDFDPDHVKSFLREQNAIHDSYIAPKESRIDLYDESGLLFGMGNQREFIGKPAHKDGHILVTGIPGSGKTQAIVIPTMMTWKGSQIIVDVKGGLYKHWLLFNKPHGKKIKVFSPGSQESCRYDPYAPLRYGGENNLASNARDLAFALMPLLPSNKDPVWVRTAQAFLTGVIIYYFNLGATFIDTMLAIQFTCVTNMIKEIMDSEDMSAKIFVNKLMEVQEKVIGNIGMEICNLAALTTDPAILNAFFI